MEIFYRFSREDGGSTFCWDWWTWRPTTVWLKHTSTPPSPVYRWVCLSFFFNKKLWGIISLSFEWNVCFYSYLCLPVCSFWTALWSRFWCFCPGGFWRHATGWSTLWPSASVSLGWERWWEPTCSLDETRAPVSNNSVIRAGSHLYCSLNLKRNGTHQILFSSGCIVGNVGTRLWQGRRKI